MNPRVQAPTTWDNVGKFKAEFGLWLTSQGIRNFRQYEIAPFGRITKLYYAGTDIGERRRRVRGAEEIIGREIEVDIERELVLVSSVPPPRHKWGNILPTLALLEELRAATGGRPIDVNSGYRDPLYNFAVGGASRSQHMEFRAVDFTARAWTRARERAWFEAHDAAGRIGLGYYRTFTHIDTRGYRARWGKGSP